MRLSRLLIVLCPLLLVGCASDFTKKGDLKAALAKPDFSGFLDNFADHPVPVAQSYPWGTTGVDFVDMHDKRAFPANTAQFLGAAGQYCVKHGGAAVWLVSGPTTWCQSEDQQGLLLFGLQLEEAPAEKPHESAVRYFSKAPTFDEVAFTTEMHDGFGYLYPLEPEKSASAPADAAERDGIRRQEISDMLKAKGLQVCQVRAGVRYIGQTVDVNEAQVQVQITRGVVTTKEGIELPVPEHDLPISDDWDDPANWQTCSR